MSDLSPTLASATVLSTRGRHWQAFSQLVLEHIENYTVPQYGDYPDDQATDFTIEEIILSMKRYLNRVQTNARGGNETLRDTLKLAHYACLLRGLVLIEVCGFMECRNCRSMFLRSRKKCPKCDYCENC